MSLERCPGCRARWAQGPTCLRCGCDLTLVRRAEAQAHRLIVRAVHAWAQGDLREAIASARAASVLEHSLLAKGVLQSLQPAGGGRAAEGSE